MRCRCRCPEIGQADGAMFAASVAGATKGGQERTPRRSAGCKETHG